MEKDYYSLLGISKNATESEIKKAYKKLAMQYHPDKNQGDKKAEEKFKKVNEAYQTIGDPEKRKQYDQFGSADSNPFGGMGGGNPFGRQKSRRSTEGPGGFEDIFSQFSGSTKNSGGFDFGDLFGGYQKDSLHTQKEEERQENLDVTEIIEIPFLDFLYDTSVSIKTVYNKTLSLKVKAGTKPGTKFRISGKGRSQNGKNGDMFVIVNAKMPKMPLDPAVEKMIEAIRYQL